MAETFPTETPPPGFWRRWFGAFRAYRDGRVAGILALGFASGLPLPLVFATMSRWLAEADVSRTTIGIFSLVGMAYAFKFVWAPLVDRLPIPLLHGLVGRRRSWIIVAQLGVIVGIAGMALTDPSMALGTMALFAVITAFSSATQDVAIDAWRIEIAPRDMQGAMAGAYQLGYRIALIVGGAGVFGIVSLVAGDQSEGVHTAWMAGYLSMAALMLGGILTAILVSEPSRPVTPETQADEARIAGMVGRAPAARFAAHVLGAVVLPFVDFFRRNGWIGILILAFIGSYWLSDRIWGVMAQPFYFDLGYSRSEVLVASKTFGVIITILGALFGGILVARVGIMKLLFAAALLAASTNLLFAGLAFYVQEFEKSFPLLFVAIGLENLFGGMAGTILIAYLSGLTNVAYTGTQYALFTSFMVLPGKLLAAGSGAVVDAVGYIDFFLYTAAAGIPAILLVLLLARLTRSEPPAPDTAEARPAE